LISESPERGKLKSARGIMHPNYLTLSGLYLLISTSSQGYTLRLNILPFQGSGGFFLSPGLAIYKNI